MSLDRHWASYNLPALLDEHGCDVAKALVGSECTCVLVLEATLRLVDSPPARSLVVLGFPDVARAGDHVLEIMAFQPIGLEGMDRVLVEAITKMKGAVPGTRKLPEGGGWPLVEFGGEVQKEADHRARRMIAALAKHGDWPQAAIFNDPHE